MIHLSRRSNIRSARKALSRLKRETAQKVEFLMDHRENRMRYDAQFAEAERLEAARTGAARAR